MPAPPPPPPAAPAAAGSSAAERRCRQARATRRLRSRELRTARRRLAATRTRAGRRRAARLVVRRRAALRRARADVPMPAATSRSAMSMSSTSTCGLQAQRRGPARARRAGGGSGRRRPTRRRRRPAASRRAARSSPAARVRSGVGADVEHLVAHDRADVELVVVDRQQHDGRPRARRAGRGRRSRTSCGRRAARRMPGWRRRNDATSSSRRHADGALKTPSATRPAPQRGELADAVRRVLERAQAARARARRTRGRPRSATTPRPARTKRSVPSALLELADLLGDRRLGDAQRVGRGGEGAELAAPRRSSGPAAETKAQPLDRTRQPSLPWRRARGAIMAA